MTYQEHLENKIVELNAENNELRLKLFNAESRIKKLEKAGTRTERDSEIESTVKKLLNLIKQSGL